MKTYKDIGSEVKTKLKDYKSSPDTMVWDTIKKKLKKKRRQVLFWYFTSGLASAIIFLILFHPIYTSNKTNFEPYQQNIPTVKSGTKHEDLRHLNDKDSSIKLNYDTINTNLKPSKNRNPHNATKTKVQLTSFDYISIKQITASKTVLNPGPNRKQQNLKNSSTNLSQKRNEDHKELHKRELSLDSSFTAFNRHSERLKNEEAEKTNTEKPIDSSTIAVGKKLTPRGNKEILKDSLDKKNNRWSITAQFIISKYGVFNAKTNNDITTNYGILLGYRLSEKAFLRIGVRQLDLMNIMDELVNKVEYLEVPIELKYAFRNKKLNPFITTGFSYFKLQNTLSQNGNNLEYLNTTLSLNFGIGLEYELIDRLYLTIESNINYQMKPLSTNVDFHPYIFSISTGLDYRF